MSDSCLCLTYRGHQNQDSLQIKKVVRPSNITIPVTLFGKAVNFKVISKSYCRVGEEPEGFE